jgi:hypothetical protein
MAAAIMTRQYLGRDEIFGSGIRRKRTKPEVLIYAMVADNVLIYGHKVTLT